MVSPATPEAGEGAEGVPEGVAAAPGLPPLPPLPPDRGVDVEAGGAGVVKEVGLAQAPSDPPIGPPRLVASDRRRAVAGRRECSPLPTPSCPRR